jgi:hypothetical protein
MSGVMRLHRLLIAAGRLRAVVFFTGELLDSDGSRVGVGSRRAVVPAEIVRSSSGIVVSVGPVEVDLIGLTVSVEASTMAMGSVVPVQGDDAEDHFEGHSS